MLWLESPSTGGRIQGDKEEGKEIGRVQKENDRKVVKMERIITMGKLQERNKETRG